MSTPHGTETSWHDYAPVLDTVGGAVDMYGDAIDTASFPAINDVCGAFTLVSMQNLDDACAEFEKLKDDSVIKGTFTCRGEDSDPESGDKPEGTTKGNGGSSGSSNSSAKDSAATSIQITGATTFLGVVAVLFGLL